VRVQREKRLWVEVEYGKFSGLIDFAVKKLELAHLCTITGLDEGEKLSFIYHLSDRSGNMLNIKTGVLKDKESIRSISPLFPGGAIYEREMVDLFGAKVEGIPEGPHYPLPDDWPEGEHPLRKNWDASVLDKEKKV
jgi:Ni,Fe-hydrogenase III component G